MKRKKIKTTSWDPKFDSEPTSNIPRMVFGHSLARDFLSNCNRLLDVGCGIGSYTQIVDKEGCVGVDLDLDALKIARRYCKNSEFIVSSALNLPFKPDIFDAVFMWEVFDEIPVHAEKPVIREIRRLLLENGVFFISLPNDHIVPNMFDPAFILRKFRHYNTDQFLKIITEEGFDTLSHTIRGQLNTSISIFLVYIYKYFLRRKEGRTKKYFDDKSSEELRKKEPGIVYAFIVARKVSTNV